MTNRSDVGNGDMTDTPTTPFILKAAGAKPLKQTVPVNVGGVQIGGKAPVVVQSMTNTDTASVAATTAQIIQLVQAGAELVRITVNNDAAAAAVPKIRDALLAQNVVVPLIGDFHFNGHRLLSKYPACAEALAKYRINPGNVGSTETKEQQFATMIEMACRYERAVRIGVNWGSLDQALLARMLDDNAISSNPLDTKAVVQEAILTSALASAAQAEAIGLNRNRIVLSCKVSGVRALIAIYRALAARCDYALHLGLTEAGMGSKGIVASTAALAVLLQEGIGDTIRVSLTPEPGGDRTREVVVAQEILQSLELRAFHPQVTACPGCGRTTSDNFQNLALAVQEHINNAMPVWRSLYPGVVNMRVAVMGCVVNGPGESKHADIGISLPGCGEHPAAPVYSDGRKIATLKGDNIANDFKAILDDYVHTRYKL